MVSTLCSAMHFECCAYLTGKLVADVLRVGALAVRAEDRGADLVGLARLRRGAEGELQQGRAVVGQGLAGLQQDHLVQVHRVATDTGLVPLAVEPDLGGVVGLAAGLG